MEEAEDRVKGLIIDEPHISNILNGVKDWEIRNRSFPYKIRNSCSNRIWHFFWCCLARAEAILIST